MSVCLCNPTPDDNNLVISGPPACSRYPECMRHPDDDFSDAIKGLVRAFARPEDGGLPDEQL